jgi:Uma2 family endonuclease
VRPDEYIRVAPDLAIEVISPSTKNLDRLRKRDLYGTFAVPEYWVADPREHCIEISVLKSRRYGDPRIVRDGVAASATLPELAIDLAVVFQGL